MNAHYQLLTQLQRYQIQTGLASGKSQASIAKDVSVHLSIISQEIRRISVKEGYEATRAQCENMIRRTISYKFSKPTMWLRRRLPKRLEDGISSE